MPSEEIYLIDALGLVYRSYHALSQTALSSRVVLDTRAIYGFTLVLLSLLNDHIHGNTVVVVFEGKKDLGELDFRTELFPAYKATRPSAPSGVKEAIPWVKKIVRALGLSVLEVDRFEADDVIGTLARKAQQAGAKSVIISADKDFRQLLESDSIQILRPLSKARSGQAYECVTEKSFRAEFADLHPARYVDVLALIGDKSDNIPGVPGIGAKTAPSIIAKYGDLNSLLKIISDPSVNTLPGLSSRQIRLLRENAEQARLSMSLVLINEKVAIENFSWELVRRKPVDKDSVVSLVNELDFDRSHILHRMLSVDNTLAPADKHELESDLFLTDFRTSETPLHEESQSFPSLAESKILAKAVPMNCRHSEDAFCKHIDSLTSFSHVSSSLSRNTELASKPVEYLNTISENTAEKIRLGERQSDLQVLRGEEADRKLQQISKEILFTDTRAVGLAVVPLQGSCESCLGIALSFDDDIVLYLDTSSCPQRYGKSFWPDLEHILVNPGVEKRGWHLKEILKSFEKHMNIRMQGRLFDLHLAGNLLHGGWNLNELAIIKRYYQSFDTVHQAGRSQLHNRLAVPDDAEAAAFSASMSMKLGHTLNCELQKNDLSDIAYKIEFPLIPVLAHMEFIGVPCDSAQLESIRHVVKTDISEIERSITTIVNEENSGRFQQNSGQTFVFRPSSRNDVSNLLFSHWKMPMKGKTKTGKPTADKRTFQEMTADGALSERQREFARFMLEHRELSKLLSTYTRSLCQAVTPKGRIHAKFAQDASLSGRLSTSNPNLQSIPARSKFGRQIRDCIRARPGFVILCADYSQIELRILAALSGDEAMLSAFREEVDVHVLVAMQLFGVKSVHDVTKEQRNLAKAVSYGIPYGVSAFGLAKQLGIKTSEASTFIRNFFAIYPGIEQLTKDLIGFARTNGYARTLFGRRQHLPLLLHGAASERRAAERVAVNMPIQGTQADMIKLAMIRVYSCLKEMRSRSEMILQVHDELVFEVAESERKIVQAMICREMCAALPLPNNVEVVVKCGFGSSWQTAAASASIRPPEDRNQAR